MITVKILPLASIPNNYPWYLHLLCAFNDLKECSTHSNRLVVSKAIELFGKLSLPACIHVFCAGKRSLLKGNWIV